MYTYFPAVSVPASAIDWFPGWLWRFGAAAAAALDVKGSGSWLCEYPVAPTASVDVARPMARVVASCDWGVVVLDANPSSSGS